MEIFIEEDRLESTWYTKPTAMRTCFSSHACALMRYESKTAEGNIDQSIMLAQIGSTARKA